MEQPSVPKMSKLLITLAFEKAENEIGSSVKNRLAKHLAFVLNEEYKYPISDRTIRDYYKYYVETNERVGEDLKPNLILYICKYLGYQNYASFVNKYPSEKKKESYPGNIGGGVKTKNKNSLILFSSAIALSGLTYFGFVKEDKNCMIWQDTHYEQTTCTGDISEIPNNAILLNNFRRITNIDSLLERRNQQKELWYAKTNGVVEFFTYHGYHPTNKKPLKNVTDYIFKTYVLDKMNDPVPTEP